MLDLDGARTGSDLDGERHRVRSAERHNVPLEEFAALDPHLRAA